MLGAVRVDDNKQLYLDASQTKCETVQLIEKHFPDMEIKFKQRLIPD